MDDLEGNSVNDDIQAPNGLFFDELSRIKIIEPEKQEKTEKLGEECKAFIDQLDNFQEIVGGFVELTDKLGKGVEAEKMKAIGARTACDSLSKKREAEEQLLLSLIAEKRAQLERIQVEQDGLLRVIQDQENFINTHIMNK
eukprot:m.85207 g.85207  ORF g.85207 m.85207 type:complete len:141 (-) comp8733_c2_seq2:628-1050(-)